MTGRAAATTGYLACVLVAVAPALMPRSDRSLIGAVCVWLLVPALLYGVAVRARRPLVLPVAAIAATVAGAPVVLFPAMINLGLRVRSPIASAVAASAALALMAGDAWRSAVEFSAAGAPVQNPLLLWLLNVAVLIAFPLCVGVAVGSRRRLVGALQAQADQARREQRFLAREAVLLERERIASEAHDMLGHKLALLSLQAGGLEVNTGAAPQARQAQAAAVRRSAADALDDLRSIIDALDGAPADGAPAGTYLSDLAALVDNSRASGADVRLSLAPHLRECGDEPSPVTRSATRRIVQESLTNALRHGSGGPIHVRVGGGPREGLALEVRNRARLEAGEPPQPHIAARRGLTGMRNTAQAAGGTLSSTRSGEEFVIRAQLPWAPAAHRPDAPTTTRDARRKTP